MRRQKHLKKLGKRSDDLHPNFLDYGDHLVVRNSFIKAATSQQGQVQEPKDDES